MTRLPGAYRAWTKDTNEDEAARAFMTRYNVPPERIIESMGLLLVGPVPQED